MTKTDISQVCGVDVGAGVVGSGFSLLEMVFSCIQSLIQLPQTSLQLVWFTCTDGTTWSGKGSKLGK